MEKTSIQFPINTTYIVILISIVALILHWYSHSSGLLLTDDSHHYLAASQSFKNLNTFIDNDGHSFLFWPPLFPIILSIIGTSGLLIWMNMILVTLIAITLFNIISRVIKHSGIGILCFIYILLGVHMLLISSFLWSELIFLLLTSFFIYTLIKSKTSTTSLYIAIIIGFFMCLQRNAGLFIATGATIWIFFNENNNRMKFIKPLIFFFCVTSGLLIWNIHVWIIVPHEQFDFSDKLFQHTVQNTNSVAYAIVNAFFPIRLFSIPVFTVVFLILIYALRKEILKNDSVQLIFIVSTVYLIFLNLVLIINIAGFHIDYNEGNRFISVIIPFLAILFFKSIDVFFDRQSNKIRISTIIFILCWLSYPLARTLKNAEQWHEVSRNNAVLLNTNEKLEN